MNVHSAVSLLVISSFLSIRTRRCTHPQSREKEKLEEREAVLQAAG